MLLISLAGSLLGFFLPLKARFFVPIGVFHFTSLCLRLACNVRREIVGVENLPKTRAFIIVANHQSTWETYALQTLAVPICTILKRELLWFPIFGWALAFLNPIAIDRSNALAASRKVLKEGEKRIKNNLNILIFPEGTRTPPGTVAEFKKSAAVLAHKTKAPIVPIAHNAGNCWRKGTFIKKSGVIKMKIGEPIETAGKTADQIHAEYESWIRKTMKELG
jgi:1-acyl-sn-glycerol-3-phosphate acyltransferase